MRHETRFREINTYFGAPSFGAPSDSTSGLDAWHGAELGSGLTRMAFGEFLVLEKVITRYDLFRALQLQDHFPGVRLGECLAKLGAMGYLDVEEYLSRWNRIQSIES